MWRLIPKLPTALLVAVIALWSIDFVHQRARHEVVRIGLTSPGIPLVQGTRGAWKLRWPEWPDSKGASVLSAYGLPYTQPNARCVVELMLRVEPRDAVQSGKVRPADSDGWFEAGFHYDWDTIARLDRSKATAVEYWVRRVEDTEASEARLDISGETDSMVLEGILIGGAARNVFALLVGVPLLIWAGTVFVRRWLRRPRGSPATSTGVGA